MNLTSFNECLDIVVSKDFGEGPLYAAHHIEQNWDETRAVYSIFFSFSLSIVFVQDLFLGDWEHQVRHVH